MVICRKCVFQLDCSESLSVSCMHTIGLEICPLIDISIYHLRLECMRTVIATDMAGLNAAAESKLNF